MPKDLITTFREFVAHEQLFTQDDKLLLACSGGLDSTVLAHVLHAEGYDFAIAHMNFRLRGEDSDGDAAFVEELARTLDAKFYGKAVNTKQEASSGESTQMVARRLRFEWLESIYAKLNFDFVLTAHHAEDNLETFFINLLRGTGIQGLAGIKPIRGYVRHPMLAITKESITNYAKEHEITWRDDISNASDDYLRNRIRHQLTPLLKESFDFNLHRWVKTASHLNTDTFLRNHGLQALEKEFVQVIAGQEVIDRKKTYPKALEILVTEKARSANFTTEQIRQILTIKGTKVFDSVSDRVYVSPEYISFEYCPNKSVSNPVIQILITNLPYKSDNNKLGFHCLNLTPRPADLNQTGHLYLTPPLGAGGLPLHLRPRKNGDRFQPLGLGGKTKKVKDYMIDAKIPVWLRDRIYLLTNDQDEIMAIPGYCISEKFKVRPEDDMVLEIRTL